MNKKKWGKAFGYSVLTYIGAAVLVGILPGGLDADPESGIFFLAIIAAIVVFFIQLYGSTKEAAIAAGMKTKKSLDAAQEIVKEVSKRVEKQSKASPKKLTEESAFEIASDEIENKTYKKGLWAIAFADADGDERKQQALNLKLRSKQLIDTQDK